MTASAPPPSSSAPPAGDPDLAALEQARAWVAAGHPVALATVTATWGSAPRGVGAHLAVRADGLFASSVSGGCVEGDVIAAARELLARDDAAVRTLNFGVADETAWRAGLACGGRIRILLENVSRAPGFLAAIPGAVRTRRRAFRLVDPADGRDAWSAGDGPVTGPLAGGAGLPLPPPAGAVSGSLAAAGRELFLRIYAPAPRLVIAGASHIAVYLARFAAALGWVVEVIDPRGAFVDAFRHQLGAESRVAVFEDWPDEVLERRPLDAFSALVTLTHDPKIDDVALAHALASSAFYIGALGSRRTHAARLKRLADKGFDEEALARIEGPVGLAIGAKGPAEIAVAIAAAVIARLRAASAEAAPCPS